MESGIRDSSAVSKRFASLYYQSFRSEMFGQMKKGLQLKLFKKNSYFYFSRFTGFNSFKLRQQFTFFFLSSLRSYFFYSFFSFFSSLFSYFFSYFLSYFFFFTTSFIIFNQRSLPFFVGESIYIAFTDLLTLFDMPLFFIAGLPMTLNFAIYFLLSISLLTTFIIIIIFMACHNRGQTIGLEKGDE